MKNNKILTTLLFLFIANKLFAQNAADKIVGTWLTEKKDAKIEIYRSGTLFFGKFVWLKDPDGPDGKLKLDEKNPDPKLRNQPIQGMTMLSGFIYEGNNIWDSGKVYDG